MEGLNGKATYCEYRCKNWSTLVVCWAVLLLLLRNYDEPSSRRTARVVMQPAITSYKQLTRGEEEKIMTFKLSLMLRRSGTLLHDHDPLTEHNTVKVNLYPRSLLATEVNN